MNRKNEDKAPPRRAPRQERSKQTVEAVLEAVRVVARREGAAAVTTNRIAEAAGVSIGTLYQYFPDKHAIFTALHQRHVEQVRAVLERALAAHGASVEEFSRVLVEGLSELHAADPELHQLVTAEVPEGPVSFRDALRDVFERVTTSERLLFVLPNLVEALVHGVAQRPPLISLESAKEEAVRTVLVYLASSSSA
ncbi:MAG TPA: TetR/AcrR family transcriptional regulator [Gemmatimonadaceae bacterium]|nr:TetR/AcrR family transcriptional regulator [Gemmatimonadaceae bacterium]